MTRGLATLVGLLDRYLGVRESVLGSAAGEAIVDGD